MQDVTGVIRFSIMSGLHWTMQMTCTAIATVYVHVTHTQSSAMDRTDSDFIKAYFIIIMIILLIV